MPVDNTWKYGSHEFSGQMLSTVDYDTKENGLLMHEFIYEDGTVPSEPETSSSSSASKSSAASSKK